MTKPSATCELWVNGTRVPDTADALMYGQVGHQASPPIVDATNRAENPIGNYPPKTWWVPSRVSVSLYVDWLHCSITDATATDAAQGLTTSTDPASSDRITVAPGDIVRVSAEARSLRKAPMACYCRFLDAAGQTIGSNTSGPVVTTDPTAWRALPEAAWTAPAGAASVSVQVALSGTGPRAVSDWLEVRRVLITVNGRAGTPWFTGDTVESHDYSYRWAGTVKDSPSERLAKEPSATALSSLKLGWGRDGQNEQPGPAACSFEILDPAGGDNALDYVHVGSTVAVWAEGHIPNPSPVGTETMDDGTFNSYPLGPTSQYFTAFAGTATVATSSDRGNVLRADNPSLPMGDGWTMIIPPRKFSPPGELPDAWDDIPKMSRGDPAWVLTLDVRAPLGTTIKLASTLLKTPYSNARTSGVSGPSTPATGDWQTLTVSHKPSTYDADHFLPAWVGFDVYVTGMTKAQWQNQTGSWDSQGTRAWAPTGIFNAVEADRGSILYPAGASPTRRVLAFSGQVSDTTMEPYGDGQTVLVKATAMDLGTQLGNKVIGDTPWPVQTIATRADRIAQLAGITSSPRVRVDPTLSGLQVSYRDVDAQPSYQLLQDLAQTGGGILWAATHSVTGAYLWIEDPGSRTALKTFTLSGGLITITASGRAVTVQSACDLLEDGAAWHQDSADVITVVAVGWLEQGVDDTGQPETTERTVTVTDTAALATYGTRRLSISTELISQTDATAMANRLLTQARAVAWRLDGITLDTAVMPEVNGSIQDSTREIALLNLLDGTTRMGLALLLVDMPAYAPLGAVSAYYVEGGSYEYVDGFWTLSLTTTPSGTQGKSATWADIKTKQPTWQWNQWSPTLAWEDAFGVVV
jgi:hypothetical protein